MRTLIITTQALTEVGTVGGGGWGDVPRILLILGKTTSLWQKIMAP